MPWPAGAVEVQDWIDLASHREPSRYFEGRNPVVERLGDPRRARAVGPGGAEVGQLVEGDEVGDAERAAELEVRLQPLGDADVGGEPDGLAWASRP